MTDLMFTFEQSPWEAFLKTKGLYDTVSAGELLTLLEGEDDQALEDAFLQLEEGCMELSIRDLPKAQASGVLCFVLTSAVNAYVVGKGR